VTFFQKICQNSVGFDGCFGSNKVGSVTTPLARQYNLQDSTAEPSKRGLKRPTYEYFLTGIPDISNINDLKNSRAADNNQASIQDAGASNPPEQPEPTVPTVPTASNLRDDLAQHLIPVFKVLSDITRLRLFLVLAECKEMNVRDLCKVLGKNQPTVSHHLTLMREVNFVTARIDGKTHYYRIIPEQIEKVIAHIFQTNVGNAGYLQFPKFQVEYHPRDKGILPRKTATSATKQNTIPCDKI
jgi:ArsR family transcriptional regulator